MYIKQLSDVVCDNPYRDLDCLVITKTESNNYCKFY